MKTFSEIFELLHCAFLNYNNIQVWSSEETLVASKKSVMQASNHRRSRRDSTVKLFGKLFNQETIYKLAITIIVM